MPELPPILRARLDAKAAVEKARQEEDRKEKLREDLLAAQTKSDHDAKEAERMRLEAESKANPVSISLRPSATTKARLGRSSSISNRPTVLKPRG